MQRTRERSKVLWAILASLLVHVVVAFSLAAFGGAFALPAPAEEKPVELTIVNLSATPPPVVAVPNPSFMETDEAKRSAEPPKEKTFESNANSIAASKLPPTGRDPLPTQEGRDLPFVQTETHSSSLASEGARPQPTPPPESQSTPSTMPSATPTPKTSQTPRSTPTPVPLSTPKPEQFAMLTATPPPPLREPETEITPVPGIAGSTPLPVPRPRPERPASSYQAQKEQTRISGRIGKNGASSVDAVETPLGRYKKQVLDAIGSRWYFLYAKKGDLVSIGTARIEAEVDQNGRVQKLNLISNNANETFANICLQSFQEAQIPPIPPELVSALPGARLPMDISFISLPSK